MPGVSFKNVESKEPIRQSVIRHRVLGVAPLSKKDQPPAETLFQGFSVFGEPGPEQIPLRVTLPRRQVVPATLRPQPTIRRPGDSQVGPVNLFLNYDLSSQEAGGGGSTQHLVVAEIYGSSRPSKLITDDVIMPPSKRRSNRKQACRRYTSKLAINCSVPKFKRNSEYALEKTSFRKSVRSFSFSPCLTL